MKTKRCNFCGSDRDEDKCIEFPYSHGGKCQLVPGTPVEICRECGMVYYDAAILKEIERRFFAIANKSEVPDDYIQIPTKTPANILFSRIPMCAGGAGWTSMFFLPGALRRRHRWNGVRPSSI